MSALTVENVSVRFGDFYAIRDVSLNAAAGEFVTLLGPSGCGKTTLLKAIAGFYRPASGTIRINGVDVTAVPPEGRETTMCFQSYALFPHLTVAENIVFGLKQKRVPAPLRAEIRQRVVRQVDLGTQLAKTPAQLSGGQQQRVALARALAMRTGVILFDEPLSNLDAKLREQVRFEILELQQEHGFTAIYVTHDQAEALAMSDRILVINQGRIEQQGTPQEIYRHPLNSFVAQFIGTANTFDARVLASAGSDSYRVATEMGELLVSSPTPPVAERVKMCWRPEAASLIAAQNGANSFTATVGLAIYQGDRTDVVIHHTNGAAQTAGSYRLQVSQNAALQRGDSIAFRIAPEDLRFLEAL